MKKHVRRLLPAAAALACLLFVSACLYAEDEVTFAMLPQIANSTVIEKWRPLLDFVEREAGVKFKVIYAKDFDSHVKLCRAGEVDFSYSNPVTYAQMAPRTGVRTGGHVAFGLAKNARGTNDFYGLFIARKDNPAIKGIRDIKGKKGMITGKSSAGGYIFQQAYALDSGIDLVNDCTITEAPSNKQEIVIKAVFLREVDFGTIRSGMLDVTKDKIDSNQLKVFAETPRHPDWVLSVSSKLDPAIVARVQKAFLKLPRELVIASKLPGGVESFVPAKDSDFAGLRKVLDKVNMDY